MKTIIYKRIPGFETNPNTIIKTIDTLSKEFLNFKEYLDKICIQKRIRIDINGWGKTEMYGMRLTPTGIVYYYLRRLEYIMIPLLIYLFKKLGYDILDFMR